MMLTHVDIAARKALNKGKIFTLTDAKIKGRRRVRMQRKLEAARRAGNEIEVAAKMICRIANGGKA